MRVKTCSCLILNYNDCETTKKLVQQIEDYLVFDHILIVDNCSTDDSYEQLQLLVSEKVAVIQTDKNGGYGYGNNVGTKYIQEHYQSKYTLLSNPDVVFTNELIERFIDSMEINDQLAVVSAKQLDIRNQPIHDLAWRVPTALEYAVLSSGRLARLFPTTYQFDKNCIEEYVDCVPGALLLYHTDRFLEVGGYDEEMFLFGEETTLGFKLREKNYKTLLILDDYYRHEHSVSINKSIAQKSKQMEILFQSRLLFMKKYLKASPLMLALARILNNHRLRKLRK